MTGRGFMGGLFTGMLMGAVVGMMVANMRDGETGFGGMARRVLRRGRAALAMDDDDME